MILVLFLFEFPYSSSEPQYNPCYFRKSSITLVVLFVSQRVHVFLEKLPKNQGISIEAQNLVPEVDSLQSHYHSLQSFGQ